MKLENVFKDYVKSFANKINYDISNEEIEEIYKGFFDENIGIVNMMISSKIQDFMFEKDHTYIKENINEMEK